MLCTYSMDDPILTSSEKRWKSKKNAFYKCCLEVLAKFTVNCQMAVKCYEEVYWDCRVNKCNSHGFQPQSSCDGSIY